MEAKDLITEQNVAGWLLIFSGIIFLPAGLMYTGRAILHWPLAQSRSFLLWERGLVMAAILVAALGFVIFRQILERAGDQILASLGMTIFLVGVVLDMAAESFSLKLDEYLYAPIVVFVVLAFVGQALFGVSILSTGFLPAWTGWTALIWNIAWLLILPLARPRDMYYPWLHYVVPLIIGIALLNRG